MMIGTPGDGHPEGTTAQLERLAPGDALDLWEEGHRVVTTVFAASETVAGRSYYWTWLFLDDGSLVEVSPDGTFRYREHQVIKQGSGLYEELVAQDGALVRFESRVRDGTSGRRPVEVTFEDRVYRIASTGMVVVQRRGATPALLPWQSFSDAEDQNVYFGLVDVADEDRVGLGLWTAHVCLSFGEPFDPSDITAIFPAERPRL
jgi:hypothetical protein